MAKKSAIIKIQGVMVAKIAESKEFGLVEKITTKLHRACKP